MSSQHEESNVSPARQVFLSIPPRLRFWTQVSGQFWGGAVLGIGLGLMLCLVLIELGAITPKKGEWSGLGVTMTIVVFAGTGIAIASRAVRSGSSTRTER